MENMYGSLQEQQAFLNAPKNQEMSATTKTVSPFNNLSGIIIKISLKKSS